MELHAISGLTLFAIVSTITPGPNNMMVMASGANYGFRRTIPHMLGIAGGVTILIMTLGAGLVRVFDAVPGSYTAMRIASVMYLCYLAYRVATAAPTPKDGSAATKPLNFIQAAAFQWVNPKAWSMSLAAIAAYAPAPGVVGVAVVAAVFAAVCLPCVSTWAALGEGMSSLLSDPRRVRVFNVSMGLLLLASLFPVLQA
ncbi:MAG: LysE family translocator [Pseudomonadota bacterium]